MDTSQAQRLPSIATSLQPRCTELVELLVTTLPCLPPILKAAGAGKPHVSTRIYALVCEPGFLQLAFFWSRMRKFLLLKDSHTFNDFPRIFMDRRDLCLISFDLLESISRHHARLVFALWCSSSPENYRKS